MSEVLIEWVVGVFWFVNILVSCEVRKVIDVVMEINNYLVFISFKFGMGKFKVLWYYVWKLDVYCCEVGYVDKIVNGMLKMIIEVIGFGMFFWLMKDLSDVVVVCLYLGY